MIKPDNTIDTQSEMRNINVIMFQLCVLAAMMLLNLIKTQPKTYMIFVIIHLLIMIIPLGVLNIYNVFSKNMQTERIAMWITQIIFTTITIYTALNL